MIRRQARRTCARRRFAVRIGTEIVRVGTRARQIRALARVAHVIAVRQRTIVAAHALSVRLAARRVILNDATHAHAIHIEIDARSAMARAAGAVAVRKGRVRAARVIARDVARARRRIAAIVVARIHGN